jgi:hypothetical protein
MNKKKRKYTKTAKWHAAHSPEALKARKVVTLTRPAAPIVPKYKIGTHVWHVDNNEPTNCVGFEVIEVKPSHYGFEYYIRRWGGGYGRTCMEEELTNIPPAKTAKPMSPMTWEQAKGNIQNRDLQIGVLKDQLHEEKGRSSAYMSQRNALHNEFESFKQLTKRISDESTSRADEIGHLKNKCARLQAIVNAFVEGKF